MYFRLIGIQIRSQLQYPVSFALDLLSVTGYTALWFFMLALLIRRFEHIAGWSLGELALLYALVETSFGLMDLVFSGFDPDRFSVFVQRGSFDQLLLRPLRIGLQVLGSAFVLKRLGRVVQGVVIFAIALRLTSIEWSVGKAVLLPVTLLSLVAFFGGLFIVGSTLTFWTVERVEAMNIFTYGGSEMMSYPMTIYQEWMRRLFTFVIPAAVLSYYPALYLLNKPDPLGLPPWTAFLAPVAGLGTLAAALLFWRFGIRHYQGTGS